MPTYAYACTECDHRFEIVQPFSADSLTVCPECEGRLRKLFNAVGIVFKGGGFYRNDSRSGAGKESGNESKESSSTPEGSGGSNGKDGHGSTGKDGRGPNGKDGGGTKGGSAGESTSSTPAASSTGTSSSTKASTAPA